MRAYITGNPMRLFAIATLTAYALLIAGALAGGLWVLAALAYMTALTALLDEWVSRRSAAANPDASQTAADVLSAFLAMAHLVSLAATVAALAGDALSLPAKLALFAAAGLVYGQVSNSNAHELIHRTDRSLRSLGVWVYVSLLFGHHASAHPLVHHRFVGTDADPNSARRGESLYRFLRRAWVGSYRAGWQAERDRLQNTGKSQLAHPYLRYWAGAALMLFLAVAIGGAWGVLAYLLLCAFAQMQLLMSDYVQHYGLRRATGDNGKPVPIAPAHSWNSPHWYSSGLMLNAPRHSDHHAHPSRPYPALTLAPDVPMLPRSLPVMACVALYPRLWRRVMDPRLAKWQQSNAA